MENIKSFEQFNNVNENKIFRMKIKILVHTISFLSRIMNMFKKNNFRINFIDYKKEYLILVDLIDYLVWLSKYERMSDILCDDELDQILKDSIDNYYKTHHRIITDDMDLILGLIKNNKVLTHFNIGRFSFEIESIVFHLETMRGYLLKYADIMDVDLSTETSNMENWPEE